MKNEISLARIMLATACPGSPALWAGSFTFYEIINQGRNKTRAKDELFPSMHVRGTFAATKP